MRPEPAASLLATPRRQKLLDTFGSAPRCRAGSSPRCTSPRWNATPSWSSNSASEAHHHAYPGGMLDHGLEIVAYALKLRQSHLLPAGATPGASRQAEAWTAGTAYAALLHDIGKIAVDLRRVRGRHGLAPWHGPLRRRTASATAGSANTGCTAPPPAALRPAARSGHLRLARRLSRPLPRCCTCWPASTSMPACSANWSCRRTRHRSPRNSAAIRARPWQRPARTAAQAARWPALPPEGRVQAEPAPGLGWLADPGRALAGEQDRLGQAARASAVAGHRRHPGQQHGGVQRAAGSRHRLGHTGRQGDLEGHRHQRCWLVAQLHLSEAVSGHGLGCGRPAGAFAGRVQADEEQGAPTPQAPAAEAPGLKAPIPCHRAPRRPRPCPPTTAAALLDLLSDTAPPVAPETPSRPVAEPSRPRHRRLRCCRR